jgi:phage terminase large subunit-like protein/ribosomal protein L37AE/L43A
LPTLEQNSSISSEVKPPVNLSLADKFNKLPIEERRRRLDALTHDEATALIYDWEFWARPNQVLPPGDWQTWLVMAGRGFGKTRIGAETVRVWAKDFNLVNLVAATSDDARDVMIEGESGLLSVCPRAERPEYLPSRRQLRWPNGGKSLIFTADEPDRLRGKQACKLWCDELAAWRYSEEAWDQAQFGLRLGKNPQAIVTTTPRPTKLVKQLAASANTFVTRGTTYENRANLAKKFYSQIITKYEGTRLGRQELDAEILTDNPGALWKRADIDATRVDKTLVPDLDRIVIGIDPAVTSNEDSDETGMVVVGRSRARPPHFYVLDDLSAIMTPNEWAQAAVKGFRRHRADRLVAETNNGGDLVEVNVRTVDQYIPYKAVHASRGKVTRAEPIAALYEQHRVHHVGTFGPLEDQMCDFNPAIDDNSPDRMDALVWAIWELSEGAGVFGVVEYIKQAQATADEEMKKVNTSTLTKPSTNAKTEKCPKCGSTSISRIGSQQRCSQCGEQFGTVKTVGQQSRRDLQK